MIIGFVTSVKFSDAIKNAFYEGLRSNGWEADPGVNPGGNPSVSILPYEADGSYDDGEGGSGMRQELYNAVSSFNANPDVNLIVAAGGLVSAHAAVKKCLNKPFLVLFGTAPKFTLTSNPNFCGGVNLDMVAKNADRNAELCNAFQIRDPKKICLIWNAKSKMGKEERQDWVTGHGWRLQERVNKNQDRDIADAFARAKRGGAQGIVVSGDPFFTSRKDVLVAAANASALKICYPFAIYKGANPPPTAGASMCLGPDLSDSYKVVGYKAATILTALSQGRNPPSTGLDVARTGRAEIWKNRSSGRAPARGKK